MTMHDHLDDETLSAALDGEAPRAALAEHTASCAACAARLATLRSAARLVATPVPPLPPAAVDELVSRTVATAATPPGDRVVSLSAGPRSRRRRPRLPAFATATIAAVTALLVGLPALMGAFDSDETSRTPTSFASGAPPEAAVTGGSSAETTDAAAPGGMAASSDATEESSAARTLGGESDLGAFEREEDLIAVLADTGGAAGAPAGDALAVASGCEPAARAVGGGRLAALQRAAPLVWRDVEAEVLVFELADPAGGLTRQAYVLDRQGCRVLAELRF